MRDNRVRAALKRGETVIGTMITEMRSPSIILLMAQVGFDFVFIDMEHTEYNLETVADMLKLARRTNLVPLVRVPDAEYHLIARVLDAGAMGIMAPRVESRETVERVVAAVRYPPLGKRGASTSKGNNDYERTPLGDYVRHANENILCVIQIERRIAVEHIDDLLSVPGVDVALMGPVDLTLSLGAPDTGDPRVEEATLQVIAAGKRHGIATGTHLRDAAQVKKWGERGMTMLMCSSDQDFLVSAATQTAAALRG